MVRAHQPWFGRLCCRTLADALTSSDHQRIRTEELHSAQKLSPNAVGSKRLKINYKSEALQLISAEGLRLIYCETEAYPLREVTLLLRKASMACRQASGRGPCSAWRP